VHYTVTVMKYVNCCTHISTCLYPPSALVHLYCVFACIFSADMKQSVNIRVLTQQKFKSPAFRKDDSNKAYVLMVMTIKLQ
jgi:hypothetical protein